MEIELDSLTTGEKVAAAAGVVTVVAAFMTWVDAGIASVAGTSGDGIFTLLFGAAVVGIVLLRDWEVVDMAATGILGALTVLIALSVYGNLEDQADEAFVEAAAGGGLHLTMLGGLALVGAAIYGFLKERDGDGESL